MELTADEVRMIEAKRARDAVSQPQMQISEFERDIILRMRRAMRMHAHAVVMGIREKMHGDTLTADVVEHVDQLLATLGIDGQAQEDRSDAGPVG